MDKVVNELSKKIIIYQRNLITDNRGWFLKVVNGNEINLPRKELEIYFVNAKEGQIRGGHYHIEANEWFTLIKGKAILILQDICSYEILKLELNSDNPQTIYVPNNVAHKFVNVGDDSFILCAYTDKLYDSLDTIEYDF